MKRFGGVKFNFGNDGGSFKFKRGLNCALKINLFRLVIVFLYL